MKNQHTEGPWEIRETPTGYSLRAKFFEMDECVGIIQKQYDNAQANARLIAAAPELLRQVVSIHAQVIDRNAHREELCGTCKLIAKAEGRE